MKKIKRPDFEQMWRDHESIDAYAYLYEWFDTYVEPLNKLIEGAVEVYTEENWQCIYKQKRHCPDATHRAYLIGIEPLEEYIEFSGTLSEMREFMEQKQSSSIKKETVEDVLRAYVKHDEMLEERGGLNDAVNQIYQRAKVVLGDDDV